MTRPRRQPTKAPPSLLGLAPSKREEPAGPLVPFVPVKSKPKAEKPPRKPMTKRTEERPPEKHGPCANMAKLLPCCRCARNPPSDPAHLLGVGAGGLDLANVVPLCKGPLGCHRFQHDIGVLEFERRTGLHLQTIANEVAQKVAEHACADFPDEAEKFCLVCEERIDGKGGVR